MSISYLKARKEHMQRIRDIYNSYVLTSTATFHEEPRTEEEMYEMLLPEDTDYPAEAWVIMDDSAGVLGLGQSSSPGSDAIEVYHRERSDLRVEAENEGESVVGYVYFSPYKKREAYMGTSEVTLYLLESKTRRGIGLDALSMIERRAEQAGIHTLLSVICGENEGSIRLFEKCSYEKCAHMKQVGRKFGRYLDVVIYQKLL